MFKHTLKWVVLVLAAGALASGCATKVREADEADERVQAAENAFGPDFKYMIIGSGSNFADKVFVSLFSTGAASDLARDLATRLAPAEQKPLRFMVTGDNPEKTAQVIVEALGFHIKGGLPYLEFLYLGEQQYVPGIREQVNRVGGRLQFSPYPA